MLAGNEGPGTAVIEPFLSPPEAINPERVFGRIEMRELPLDSLIMLNQIRLADNPARARLKESINSEDLDNQPNVARVNDEEFTAYIDFVNSVWGGKHQLSDFTHLRQADGLFNLVVAGHNRVGSMQDIAADASGGGADTSEWKSVCKIMKDNSVQAIVAKQASENIHATVALEREAMAVVELYFFGLEQGNWTGPEEFRATQGRKIGKRMLEDAFAFASLPRSVREVVLEGHISYKAGVSLGNAAPVIKAKFALEAGLDIATNDEDIDAALTERLHMEVAHIKTERLNTTAAAKYIESIVQRMNADIMNMVSETEADGSTPQPKTPFGQADLFVIMRSPASQAQAIRRREEARAERAMRELAAGPAVAVAAVLACFSQVDQHEALDLVVEDTTAANTRLAQHVRERVAAAALANVTPLLFADSETEEAKAIAV